MEKTLKVDEPVLKDSYTWQDLERAYKQGIIKGLSMSYREELN